MKRGKIMLNTVAGAILGGFAALLFILLIKSAHALLSEYALGWVVDLPLIAFVSWALLRWIIRKARPNKQ